MSVRDEDREAHLEAPEGRADDVQEEADLIKLLITGYGESLDPPLLVA